MESEASAAESLAVDHESRSAAVHRSRSPRWYYPATGTVVGATIVAVLLARGIGPGVAVILMALSTLVLDFARRRVTGTRTTEFGRGRASAYAAIFLVLGLATLAAGRYLVLEQDVTWVAWLTGLVVGVLLVVGGAVFERTLNTSIKR